VDAETIVDIHSVLDVGCGSGELLVPFADDGAFCVGIDIAVETGSWTLLAQAVPRRLSFLRADAERLPLKESTFDVVLSQLALPYTHNETAIAEMARVLRPEGVLLLRIHHLRYYINLLKQGIHARQPKAVLYAARVLIGGALYHATGRQSRRSILGREIFQTRWSLDRALTRFGLVILKELENSTKRAPSYLIRRLDRKDR
jgi:SAM-dependent methyltransferase